MTNWTSTFIDMSFNPEIRNFSAIGQCQFSNAIVYMDDMVPYLEYAGNSLYNTGLMGHKMFVDQPQPALLAPKIVLDPEPVPNPRPPLNFLPWP